MQVTRENLKKGLEIISRQQNLMLDIYNGHPDEKDSGAVLRFRHMNTAGGVQFCLKEVMQHGEGSGYYTPISHTEQFLDTAMNVFHQKEQSSKRIRELYRRSSSASIREKFKDDAKFYLTIQLNHVPTSINATLVDDYLNSMHVDTITLSLEQ